MPDCMVDAQLLAIVKRVIVLVYSRSHLCRGRGAEIMAPGAQIANLGFTASQVHRRFEE